MRSRPGLPSPTADVASCRRPCPSHGLHRVRVLQPPQRGPRLALPLGGQLRMLRPSASPHRVAQDEARNELMLSVADGTSIIRVPVGKVRGGGRAVAGRPCSPTAGSLARAFPALWPQRARWSTSRTPMRTAASIDPPTRARVSSAVPGPSPPRRASPTLPRIPNPEHSGGTCSQRGGEDCGRAPGP